MIKKILILVLSAILISGALCACGTKESNKVEGNKKESKEIDVPVEGPKISVNGDAPSGLPDGFPQEIPFYEDAKIIDADTYGEDGFTVVYQVDDEYENVVGFYMTNVDGLDESGIGEEESYFEGIDMGDIHINGLTITDVGDATHVFITLRNYGEQTGNVSDSSFTDDTEDSADYEDSDLITYENAEEVELDGKYPIDIVPIYPNAKVIDCSLAPSGDGFVNLVLPTNEFKDAVQFYADELGLESDSFKSDLMISESFSGDIDGCKISVLIGQLKIDGNDPLVTITVNK